MSHIRFLEDNDLYRIRTTAGINLRLERGHILYNDSGRPEGLCEIIMKDANSRRKIKARVGQAVTAEGIQLVPNEIVSNRNYSGSLALGDLESRTIEGLQHVYADGIISAEQYDFYSRIVGMSKEDLTRMDPTKLQATLAILGAFVGALYEPGLSPVMIGAGTGGALASLYLYLKERQHQRNILPDVKKIKQMIGL